MESRATVLSLLIDKYTVHSSLFNGNEIHLYTPYRDCFTYKSTKVLLELLNPSVIIVETFIGLSPLLNKENIDKFHKISIGQRNKIFSNISKGENRCLRLLSHYFSIFELVSVENINILGYLGSYPIKRLEWNTFYIDNCIDDLLVDNNTLKNILKGTKTKYGKIIIKKWIFHPLETAQQIYQRRKILEFIMPILPKVSRLLKQCKDVEINKNLDIKKLKKGFKSVFNLAELMNEKVKLEAKSRYLKVYKFLKFFENQYCKVRTKESEDIGKENIYSWIDTMAESLSKTFGFSLSVVYFPEIGFLIESSYAIEKVLFKIKDKFYSKNNSMNELDYKITDYYDEKNRKESNEFSKLISRIKSVKYAHLYDFIGEIDALVSIALNNIGQYNEIFNDTELLLDGIELYQKNIFLNEFQGKQIANMVVLNQIGSKLSNLNVRIPIYKKLAYLSKNSIFNEIKNSFFQKEVRKVGIIFRECNHDTCCIIEQPFHSTTPIEGFELFSELCKKIVVKNLFISTKFEFSRCDKLCKEIKAKLLLINEANTFIEAENINMKDSSAEINKICAIGIWLLFKNISAY